MADDPFTTALDGTRQIDITVTGRRTGREISLPVWCATPISDPAMIREVFDKFRARYGDRDVAAYSPTQDAAVEVRLA